MVQVDECNAIDMANIMYSFVAMEYDPGLLILDSIAWHVNNRYQEYGPVEMARCSPTSGCMLQYFACSPSILHATEVCILPPHVAACYLTTEKGKGEPP